MKYIIGRLLSIIPVVLVVTFVVFGMLFLSGDPAVLMLPPEATTEEVEAFRELHGFNDPFLEQYGRFLKGMLQGDFGTSFRYNRPALSLVLERVPATLQLSGFSILISVLLGIPLGTLSALHRNTAIDYFASVISVMGQSMPNFWLAFLLMYLFAVNLSWVPTSGGPGIKYVILPAATIGFNVTALITRMTRSSIMEAMREDYVRTARGKGVPEKMVIIEHVMRNSILPVVSVIALQFGYILGGAVVVEQIFAWPGLGLLTVQAINNRDYPIVQATVLFLALSFVLINLICDLFYRFIDPRIRTS